MVETRSTRGTAGAGTSQTLAQFQQLQREHARREREGEFDATRFRGREQEVEYGRVWNTRKIVVERRWVVSQFEAEPYGWLRPLTDRQWLGLASFRGQYSATLVAEFMANISSDPVCGDRHILRSWVRGRDIVITPDSFTEQFGLPRVAHPEFTYDGEHPPSHKEMCAEILAPGESWTASQIRVRQIAPRYHPLFLWTCYSIFPLGRTVECSRMRGQLLWAIGTGRSIDLPHFMYMALWSAS